MTAGASIVASSRIRPAANRFIHMWVYKSLDQRLAIREEARQKRIWPPPGGGDNLFAQENKILLPAVFSPRQ